MQAAVARGGTALARIRLAGHAYVEDGLKHPDPYAFVRGLAAELVAEGFVAADEKQVAVVAQILWEGLHGMTSLRVSTGDDPWINRIDAGAHLDLLLDILLLGIVQRFPGRKSAAAVKLLSGKR